jgi:hypothetical protein
MTIVDRTVELFGLVIEDLRIDLNVPQLSRDSDDFSRISFGPVARLPLKILSAQRPTPIA